MEKEKRSWFFRTADWIKHAFSALAAHRYTTIAGTLVFFLVMSLVPFLFWLMLAFSKTGLDTDQIIGMELFGWAEELLIFLRNNAEIGAAAGVSVLFLATTLWSSTGFFYHLRRSGEIIYNYRRVKHGWKVRLSAVLFTLLLLVFFAFSGALLIGTDYFARSLPQWLFYLTEYSLVLVLGFFSAWMLNTYICPYKTSPADTVIGSLFTAFAWLIASIVFMLYNTFFARPERLYGALSLVIVFLLWLYWMMICFTAGVIYNRHRMQLKGKEHKKL